MQPAGCVVVMHTDLKLMKRLFYATVNTEAVGGFMMLVSIQIQRFIFIIIMIVILTIYVLYHYNRSDIFTVLDRSSY